MQQAVIFICSTHEDFGEHEINSNVKSEIDK